MGKHVAVTSVQKASTRKCVATMPVQKNIKNQFTNNQWVIDFVKNHSTDFHRFKRIIDPITGLDYQDCQVIDF